MGKWWAGGLFLIGWLGGKKEKKEKREVESG